MPEQIEIPGELYQRGSGAGFGGKGKRVPQVRQAKAQIDGALVRDEVRKVVREHINEVRSCFNLGIMGKRAALVGRMAIEFEIGPDGKVRYAKVVEDTGKEPAVGACVVKAIERWRFPKPKDGEPVTVVYPFNLYPG